MKTALCVAIATLMCSLCGCTTYALRQNAINQTKTVSDFLADEVLYNLAAYKDYYEGNRANGLPAFVKLSSGQSQVQQSINAQLALKYPATGLGFEKDPQISGNHQTSDNWVFAPVVDPNELNRLFMLYKSQFKELQPDEVKTALPKAKPELDQEGRPILTYTPRMKGGVVEMKENRPQFDAKPKDPPQDRKIEEIPGAIVGGRKTNEWFSFTAPANNTNGPSFGPYLGRKIWITDKEKFFKFTWLVLGGNGGEKISKPSSAILLQNGNNIFMLQ